MIYIVQCITFILCCTEYVYYMLYWVSILCCTGWVCYAVLRVATVSTYHEEVSVRLELWTFVQYQGATRGRYCCDLFEIASNKKPQKWMTPASTWNYQLIYIKIKSRHGSRKLEIIWDNIRLWSRRHISGTA